MSNFKSKMATEQTESPPVTQKPWPNRKEDYELLEVIGKQRITAPYHIRVKAEK